MLAGHLLKTKKELKKLIQTGNTDFIYKYNLGKACIEHDMVQGKHKDLNKRTQSDKVLRDKVFEVASDPKHDGYQRGLASMVYNFFDKNSIVGGIKSRSMNNLQMNFIN